MYKPWDRLCRVIVHFKKSSSTHNVNEVPESTKKQWEIDAKNWNDFIVKYEPRIDFATQELLTDRTAEVKGAVRSSIYDAYDLNKGYANPQADENTLLKDTGKLGGALAKAEIGAEEHIKDYNVSNLNTAINLLHGEKSGALKGLQVASDEAVKTQTAGVAAGMETDSALAKLRSANIGGGVTAIGATAKQFGGK